MLKAKKPVKVSQKEIREDNLVTAYTRFMGWYYKNERTVLIAGAALLLVIIGSISWAFLKSSQEEEAADLLAKVYPMVATQQWEKALNGDSTNASVGLAAIADDFSGTSSGSIAAFYAGKANMELGNYEQAFEYFDMVSSKSPHLEAAALGGMAAVYEHQKEPAKASDLYSKAAEKAGNPLLTPRYLYLAALTAAEAGEYSNAIDFLTDLKENYKDASYTRDADKLLALYQAKSLN